MPARSWSRRVRPGPHPSPCPHPCPHPHPYPRPPPVTPSCSRPPASPRVAPCRTPFRPRVHDLADHPSHQQVRIERACCGVPYWRDTRSTRRCFRRPAGLSRSMGDRRASGGPCAKPSGTPFGRDLAPTSEPRVEPRSEPPTEACMEPSQCRPLRGGGVARTPHRLTGHFPDIRCGPPFGSVVFRMACPASESGWFPARWCFDLCASHTG